MKLIMPSISKSINYIFIIFSLAGFLDATYLTTKHFLEQTVPCSLTSGCEVVLTSQYSTLFNVPTALWGAIYYLIVLLSALIYLNNKNKLANHILSYFTTIGFLASLGFVYLQIFVLNSICTYCMVSAVTSTILFISSIYLLLNNKQSKEEKYEQ